MNFDRGQIPSGAYVGQFENSLTSGRAPWTYKGGLVQLGIINSPIMRSCQGTVVMQGVYSDCLNTGRWRVLDFKLKQPDT